MSGWRSIWCLSQPVVPTKSKAPDMLLGRRADPNINSQPARRLVAPAGAASARPSCRAARSARGPVPPPDSRPRKPAGQGVHVRTRACTRSEKRGQHLTNPLRLPRPAFLWNSVLHQLPTPIEPGPLFKLKLRESGAPPRSRAARTSISEGRSRLHGEQGSAGTHPRPEAVLAPLCALGAEADAGVPERRVMH